MAHRKDLTSVEAFFSTCQFVQEVVDTFPSKTRLCISNSQTLATDYVMLHQMLVQNIEESLEQMDKENRNKQSDNCTILKNKLAIFKPLCLELQRWEKERKAIKRLCFASQSTVEYFRLKMEDVAPKKIFTSLEILLKDMETVGTAMKKKPRENEFSNEDWLAWIQTAEKVQGDLFSFCKDLVNVKKPRLEEKYLSDQQREVFSELENRCNALVAKGEAMCKSLDSS